MDAWDRLNHRWNLFQSEEISRTKFDVAKLAIEFAELEKFIIYLAGMSALGQPLTPDDPVLKKYIGLERRDDPKAALLHLVASLQDRAKPRIIECPKCGAGVRDLKGVFDEKCQFCGAVVRTRD